MNLLQAKLKEEIQKEEIQNQLNNDEIIKNSLIEFYAEWQGVKFTKLNKAFYKKAYWASRRLIKDL